MQSADDLFSELSFSHGKPLKNRFMVAPLTNIQSHGDGSLSSAELEWLAMRAHGGFAATMTCAAHVQRQGQGFPGQLGIFSDDLLPGLSRLASAIREGGGLGIVQLHHSGRRSPVELTGSTPVAPSDDPETGARALTESEVRQLVADFVEAAVRAEKAGFDGVELHGAHSYILSQFLSPDFNRRSDAYGGSAAKRARIIHEIIDGIRARCSGDFNLGIRLSPERYGQRLPEIRELAQQLMRSGDLDYIDLSLWNVFKQPQDDDFKSRRLIDWFTDLERGNTRLGVAGRIYSAETARACLAAGADFVLLGRAAILHHDFPRRVSADPGFEMTPPPVTRAYLRDQGLSPIFIDYMAQNWPDFIDG